jgi:2-oxoglutarate dehydrogenase E2 component (dihydrolipoamide succinyltransferase)
MTMSDLIKISLPADQLEGTSATFSAWLVSTGTQVEEGTPIAELETDKVSMEICASVSGTIADQIAKVGEPVEPEQVLGHIDTAAKADSAPAVSQDEVTTVAANQSQSNDVANSSPKAASTLLSPAVRRLIKQHNVDIGLINGTGRDGRVNRNDVLVFVKNQAEKTTQQPPVQQSQQATRQPLKASDLIIPRAPTGEKIPHTNMRKSIANHMVESLLNTSPHVTSVFELDMTNIIEHRKWHKKEFAELGVNLTFTTYFLAAMAKACEQVPQTNARFHEDALEIFKDINIGVGTALGDSGLVVPVVHQVQSRNLFEIAQALNEQTEKARSGKLKPNDMQHGTITISNHGVSGSLFASPIIINQPQVAIVGIGKMEKRVKVIEINGQDTMQIKPMCYVSLSIDHRALDAHQTNQWLAAFVNVLETWGQ